MRILGKSLEIDQGSERFARRIITGGGVHGVQPENVGEEMRGARGGPCAATHFRGAVGLKIRTRLGLSS